MKEHPLYVINRTNYTVIDGTIHRLSVADKRQTQTFMDTLIANSQPSIKNRIKRILSRPLFTKGGKHAE